MFGVARSPKLVKRNGARPQGAVRKVAVKGCAALLSLSAVTMYWCSESGERPSMRAWYVNTVWPLSPSVYVR